MYGCIHSLLRHIMRQLLRYFSDDGCLLYSIDVSWKEIVVLTMKITNKEQMNVQVNLVDGQTTKLMD